MRRFFLGILLLLALCVPSHMTWAQGEVGGTTEGKLGETLSTQFYCDTKGLIEGELGMAVGLVLMFGALWSMIHGGSVPGAVSTMIFGALITALPSLIESSLGGLSTLMVDSGMSTAATAYKAPDCSETLSQRVDRNLEAGYCTGGIDCM